MNQAEEAGHCSKPRIQTPLPGKGAMFGEAPVLIPGEVEESLCPPALGHLLLLLTPPTPYRSLETLGCRPQPAVPRQCSETGFSGDGERGADS